MTRTDEFPTRPMARRPVSANGPRHALFKIFPASVIPAALSAFASPSRRRTLAAAPARRPARASSRRVAVRCRAGRSWRSPEFPWRGWRYSREVARRRAAVALARATRAGAAQALRSDAAGGQPARAGRRPTRLRKFVLPSATKSRPSRLTRQRPRKSVSSASFRPVGRRSPAGRNTRSTTGEALPVGKVAPPTGKDTLPVR